MAAFLPALGLGTSTFFAIRSFGRLARRQWRRAAFEAGKFLGIFALSLLFLGVFGAFVVGGSEHAPSTRARALAEFISATMNCGAFVGILAAGAALADTLWFEPKRRDSGP